MFLGCKSRAHLAVALALLLLRRHSLRAPLIVHGCVRTLFNFSVSYIFLRFAFQLPCDCAITCGRYLFLHRWCVCQCFLSMHVFRKRAKLVFECTCVCHCHSCGDLFPGRVELSDNLGRHDGCKHSLCYKQLCCQQRRRYEHAVLMSCPLAAAKHASRMARSRYEERSGVKPNVCVVSR